jgi:hypothetical protein
VAEKGNGKVGSVQLGKEPVEFWPSILRTKQRDIPFIGPFDQRRTVSNEREGGRSNEIDVAQSLDEDVGFVGPIAFTEDPITNPDQDQEVDIAGLEFSAGTEK